MVSKAQESGAREGLHSPGNPGLRMSPDSFAECNAQKVLPHFSFSHTPRYPQTTLLSPQPELFKRNNNRSGANHVRNIYTPYVGLLCVN